MSKSDDELELGIDTGVLLRTKIRNTLYNRKVGFSMADAGDKTANEMLDELVEDIASKAEQLIHARDAEREAAIRIDQVMKDEISFSLGTSADESELIAVRQHLVAKLEAIKRKDESDEH